MANYSLLPQETGKPISSGGVTVQNDIYFVLVGTWAIAKHSIQAGNRDTPSPASFRRKINGATPVQ